MPIAVLPVLAIGSGVIVGLVLGLVGAGGRSSPSRCSSTLSAFLHPTWRWHGGSRGRPQCGREPWCPRGAFLLALAPRLRVSGLQGLGALRAGEACPVAVQRLPHAGVADGGHD